MTESPFDTGEPGRILRHAPAGKRPAWRRCFPGLVTLQHYNSSWLRHDLVAALVMTTMLVPVGVAYAEASGVPGINGLYATIVPLLATATSSQRSAKRSTPTSRPILSNGSTGSKERSPNGQAQLRSGRSRFPA